MCSTSLFLPLILQGQLLMCLSQIVHYCAFFTRTVLLPLLESELESFHLSLPSLFTRPTAGTRHNSHHVTSRRNDNAFRAWQELKGRGTIGREIVQDGPGIAALGSAPELCLNTLRHCLVVLRRNVSICHSLSKCNMFCQDEEISVRSLPVPDSQWTMHKTGLHYAF